jgi:predicted phage-related endonuclease
MNSPIIIESPRQEKFIRLPYSTKEEWLGLRMIGGSSASAIIGENPYMTNVECWEKLIKRRKGVLIDTEEENEISSKPQVIYGKKAEEHLRNLFALRYVDKYKVTYTKEVLQSIYYPYITGSLDGELLEKSTGKRGVFENKTIDLTLNPSLKAQWGQYGDRTIPQNHFAQSLHYLYVTGYDFVIVNAEFRYLVNRDCIGTYTNEYRWEREEVLEDMKYLIENEVEFMEKYVIPELRPPRKIAF